MSVLYSNIPPLKRPEGGIEFQTYIRGRIAECDKLVIASGYASKNSLDELRRLVNENGLADVSLVLGMYYLEGFPERIFNEAVKLNDEWSESGIGDIRVVRSIKYHGKVYGFYNNGILNSVIVGSNNLGSIISDESNRRQYEISLSTDDPEECREIDQHLNAVLSDAVSVPINKASNIRLIHEVNEKLKKVEGAREVSQAEIEYYKNKITDISFDIPLKVPGIPGASDDYMKSNINKCYAKGRLNSRTGEVSERGWWETEIVVAKSITSKPGYPGRAPFYVITDDGWSFKAHVSGTNYKNFESDYDLKILGYWLKGRLVAAGLIEPVDSPSEDLKNRLENGPDIYQNCKGVITYQKLQKYGRTSVSFTKTTEKLKDENGSDLDVWLLSFLPDNVQ